MTSVFPWTDAMRAVFTRVGRAAVPGRSVTPVDVAIALLELDDGDAPRWWREREFDAGRAIAELRLRSGAAASGRVGVVKPRVRFDGATRQVLKNSLVIAIQNGTMFAGTPHLLAALLPVDPIGEVFAAQGLTAESVGSCLHALRGGSGRERPLDTPSRRTRLIAGMGAWRSTLSVGSMVAILVCLAFVAVCVIGPIVF